MELRDTCRGRADDECAKAVNAQFRDNRTNYRHVRQEINPRRLQARKFIRFVMHINELKQIGDSMGSAFGTSIQILNGLNAFGADFCEDFQQDLQFLSQYTTHSDYITSLYTHALANDGQTGADVAKIRATRKFTKQAWTKINKQF
jgi:hypothetical protein